MGHTAKDQAGPDRRSLEPLILAAGKQFHHDVRVAYLDEWPVGSTATEEASVRRSRGTAQWAEDGLRKPVRLRRNGWADVLIQYVNDEGLTTSVILEIKNTDWDRIPEYRVQPNLSRHRRQVWGYLEPLLVAADAGQIGYPQACVVYPRRPIRPDLAIMIETYLSDDYGITVAYAPELLDT